MQIKDFQGLFLQSPQLNKLNILREVASNPRITQAALAKRCSLSVAMVNNYMKELCGSGLLEYHRRTIKSVTYHLTPAGTQRLEALQARLIHEMVGMFVAAKKQIRDHITSRTRSNLKRVVLFGTGNLAQLAFHALELAGVQILGICDDNPEMIGKDFCGREVVNASQIRYLAPDAVVVADSDSAKAEEICRNLDYVRGHGIDLIRLDLQGSQASSLPSGLASHRNPRRSA